MPVTLQAPARATTAPPPARAAHSPPRNAWLPARPSRVAFLIIAILLASLTDLAITLEFITTVGMAEANPIARAVIGAGSVPLLVGFKLVMSLSACAVFWIARTRPSGELGAWVGALVMAWLMVRWDAYIDHSHVFTAGLHGEQQVLDSRWVVMVPAE